MTGAATRAFGVGLLRDLLDDAEEVRSRAWRHGRHVTFVFELAGEHWMVEIPVHHEEGFQFAGSTVEAKLVHKVTKTVEVWEPVP